MERSFTWRGLAIIALAVFGGLVQRSVAAENIRFYTKVTFDPGRESGENHIKARNRPNEPDEETAIKDSAVALLLGGDTQHFDELASRYRASEERTSSGTWKLSMLYNAIDAQSFDPLDPHWKDLEDLSDAWLAKEPDSPTRLGVWMLVFGAASAYLLTTIPWANPQETGMVMAGLIVIAVAGALLAVNVVTSRVILRVDDLELRRLVGGKVIRRSDILGVRRRALGAGLRIVEVVPRIAGVTPLLIPPVLRADDAFRLWFESLPALAKDRREAA